MSMVQSRQNVLSNNVKTVLKYLDLQFQSCWDDVEQDIATGYTDLSKEIKNMRSALSVLKFYHKEDKKQVLMINKYLQLLSKEY